MPLISGYLYDITNYPTVPVLFYGIMMIIGGLNMMVIPKLQKMLHSKDDLNVATQLDDMGCTNKLTSKTTDPDNNHSKGNEFLS